MKKTFSSKTYYSVVIIDILGITTFSRMTLCISTVSIRKMSITTLSTTAT
jgi:hypothetical protein